MSACRLNGRRPADPPLGLLLGLQAVGLALSALSTAAAQPAAPKPAAETRDLSLAVGENRTISADGVKSYSLGAAGVAEVRLTPNGKQFVVVGKAPGSTTLLCLYGDEREVLWQINVFARSVQSVEDELQQLLGESPGIRVRRVGSRFFIEGGVSNESELERIKHVANLYEGQVESLVVLGGAAANRSINVRIDVFFIQYEKTKTSQIGIDWPARLGGPFIASEFTYDFLAGTTAQATASVVDHPLPALDLASRAGYAKVLKHATVITANGSEATFENGGAQNYQVTSGLVAAIQRIEFGTNIKVLPRFDPARGRLEVQVNVDVADLTPPVTETVLPGENTSTLTTLVSLKLGESLVLSGIHTQNERSLNRGVPWLSEIPIIGRLFGSVGEEKRDVEGAVIIVPGIVESIPSNANELIERALSEYEEFDGDLDAVDPAAGMPSVRGGRTRSITAGGAR